LTVFQLTFLHTFQLVLTISIKKIFIVNRLLEKIRFILTEDDSLEFLDILNEDDIPQVSDVTIILSQYVAAMETFKEKYFGWNGLDRGWFLSNK
jgi:hypothetical protein